MDGNWSGFKMPAGQSNLNSISLKEGEEKFKEYARKILSYGAATVECFWWDRPGWLIGAPQGNLPAFV